MLDAMSDALPQYKEILDGYRQRRNSLLAGPKLGDRIAKALSLVYTDVLQYCLDVCKLFSAKRHGKCQSQCGWQWTLTVRLKTRRTL